MSEGFRVPRSRASQTHRALRDEIIAALEPILFDAYQHSYPLRSQLEAVFAAEAGQRYAVAAHSGTVALVIALRACGIGPGDDVITVGNSDISTTGAIRPLRRKARVCDVLESTTPWNRDGPSANHRARAPAILPWTCMVTQLSQNFLRALPIATSSRHRNAALRLRRKVTGC